MESGSSSSAGLAARCLDTSLDSNEWRAYSSSEHGGRVFWMHAVSGQRTWAQPLPQMVHVRDALTSPEAHRLMSSATRVAGPEFEQICWMCTQPFGSNVVSSKTISGDVPCIEDVIRAMEQIAPEFGCYPSSFPSKAGLDRIVFCARLHYDGQRRGHVPSFYSRTMYIDCMAQPKRRVVSSFHHELWHFADYTMLGRDYEFADREWLALNPSGFSYGKGGAAMRSEDSTSGYMGSAQSDAFLNRYSTASAAEDKAEVWAALLTDMRLVESSPTLIRKRDLLKQRATDLLQAMRSSEFWERIRAAQIIARRDEDDWEEYVTESGRPWWFNRVTHEKRWDRPDRPTPAKSTQTLRMRSSSHAQVEVAPMQREAVGGTTELMHAPSAVCEDRLERQPSISTSEASGSKRPRLFSCFDCLSSCFCCVRPPVVEHADPV